MTFTRTKTSYMARRDGEMPADDDPLLTFAPVLHTQPKKNSIGPERQRKFIAALAASGVITDAARHIGATPEALHNLRNRPGAEEFRAAWDAAIDRAISRVESEAVTRAIEGAERPIVSGGKLLGTYRVHPEGLVMFLLRHHRPATYGSVPQRALKPGHPEYERIRWELSSREPDIEEVRAELLRKTEAIERARKREWLDAVARYWPTGRNDLVPRPA